MSSYQLCICKYAVDIVQFTSKSAWQAAPGAFGKRPGLRHLRSAGSPAQGDAGTVEQAQTMAIMTNTSGKQQLLRRTDQRQSFTFPGRHIKRLVMIFQALGRTVQSQLQALAALAEIDGQGLCLQPGNIDTLPTFFHGIEKQHATIRRE